MKAPETPSVGVRFGLLTVTEHAGKLNGQHIWKCRCACGKEIIASQTKLEKGELKCCNQCRLGISAFTLRCFTGENDDFQ